MSLLVKQDRHDGLWLIGIHTLRCWFAIRRENQIEISCSPFIWLVRSWFVKPVLQMVSGIVVVCNRLQGCHNKEGCRWQDWLARFGSTSLREWVGRLKVETVNACNLTQHEADKWESGVLGHGFGVGGAGGLASKSGVRSKVLAFFWLGVGSARWAFSPPAHLQLMLTVGRTNTFQSLGLREKLNCEFS